MIGLETSLAITLTQLYHTGKMELPEIIRRMSTNPSDILHLPKGRMSLGVDGDLTIFDPNEEWTVVRSGSLPRPGIPPSAAGRSRAGLNVPLSRPGHLPPGRDIT